MAVIGLGTAQAQPRTLPRQVEVSVADFDRGIRAECRAKGGRITVGKHLVTELGLNADSVPDYMIDLGAYDCSAGMLGDCGMLGCATYAMVSTPGGYRAIDFVVTRGFTPIANPGGDVLEVLVRASDCGPRANECRRYWRLVGPRFQMFSTLAAARAAQAPDVAFGSSPPGPPASSGPPPLAPLRPGFRTMQLPAGLRVAALDGIGAMRTLSLGCLNGAPTMLLATRMPMRPTEVTLRTPTRSFVATPQAQRPTLWAFRLADDALANVLTSPEAGFTVSIGGSDAGTYSLSGAAAVRAALAPCARATAAAALPAPASASPTASAPIGVMGIPIRQGSYVPATGRCDRALYVFRAEANGHAEGYASDGKPLTRIRWKRPIRKRDGSYDVQYMPAPGDVAGDEIVINIKPVSADSFDLTIQDTQRMRRCEPATLPAWARR